MPGRIFINYRRDDSGAEARSVYQRLERVFGKGRLFIDVDSIQKGRDFTKVLDEHLTRSDVMLALVGRRWLSAEDESGHRRLDDPEDFVRLEIARALKRDIPVIPVLVDGAVMPKAIDLPDDLKAFSRRQASIVTHENFGRDMDGLESDLKSLLKPTSRLRWTVAGFAVALFGLAVLAYQDGRLSSITRMLVGSEDSATTRPTSLPTNDSRLTKDSPQSEEGGSSIEEVNTQPGIENTPDQEASTDAAAPPPSTQISSKLTGNYKAVLGGVGEGDLEVRTNLDGSQYFAAEIWFENGHSCQLSGTAIPLDMGWRYMDGSTCILEIRSDGGGKLTFKTEPDASCSDYCGARGYLDGISFRRMN